EDVIKAVKSLKYEIYETETFSKIFECLTEREKGWIRKMKVQIRSNPRTGKPLRFDWFREKKFENKRLYFIVSMKKPRILLISYASKKEQQKVIDYIMLHKDEYIDFLNTF
ncbi:MAG: hypothetical protein QMD97_01670, partial [Candidatus Aenigmarchaeota archaeon]|nr:hypothetical protein [Candidatus Aenigmarchaeota archaeon]